MINKEKVSFPIMCEQIEKMSKAEIARHLHDLGCTWSYEKIQEELLKTFNELKIADDIFKECEISDKNSAFPIEFIDEAVLQIVERETYPFMHYGLISSELITFIDSELDNKEEIEIIEMLFRKLFKLAKTFQITSLEAMMYQVNDGIDLLSIVTYLLDLMMSEGRENVAYYKRIISFVDKFFLVFSKTSSFLKVTLQYEQAQAYIALKSKKGEQMFLNLLKTHSDPTDVVLHYALAYIDDNEDKTKKILQKYTPILDTNSESYAIIQEIKKDLDCVY